MAESSQRHEDPLQDWVLAKFEAISARLRSIRLHKLYAPILLVLGTACLVSLALNGFMHGSDGRWEFVVAMQQSPHQLITAAICFHSLASQQKAEAQNTTRKIDRR